MQIERLNKKEAAEAMRTWIANSFTLPTVSKDYLEIRGALNSLFRDSRKEVGDSVKSYQMDVCFGTALFEYLQGYPWFTDRLAADDGFWRYLSLKVVPNLVGQRWSNDNADHYYTKPSRIWLKTIWWYVYLSKKRGEMSRTKAMLLSGNFSTDTILNLVERTGQGGTNILVYRGIMSKYAMLEDADDKKFRSVMKLNTAKSVVVEPTFFEDGIPGYVNTLFKELSLA